MAAGVGGLIVPVKAGDVIVEVNGREDRRPRDLARKIAELHPNTEVRLSIADREVNLLIMFRERWLRGEDLNL